MLTLSSLCIRRTQRRNEGEFVKHSVSQATAIPSRGPPSAILTHGPVGPGPRGPEQKQSEKGAKRHKMIEKKLSSKVHSCGPQGPEWGLNGPDYCRVLEKENS